MHPFDFIRNNDEKLGQYFIYPWHKGKNMQELEQENSKKQEVADNVAMTKLQDVFNLAHDQAHPDKIDSVIRANTRVSGTNMWVLIFAIAVASIGLNVNSTAVVIGAMLISPLMGPIVGMGYGLAVGDTTLIRQAARNIIIFVVISLITATLYFLLTPLKEAQSELLARTQPTLWDVLIAFFGGSAGIVALTRKEGGNAIPGVAIATALMPPLCTAGYGLAHGNWQYFFGASYLFAINCVFIAFSTLLFSKLLKLPRRGLVTESKRRLQSIMITVVVLAVMIPSGYMASGLVRQELFNTKANAAITAAQQQESFFVLRKVLNYKENKVGLIVNGTGNAEKIIALLEKSLNASGVKEPEVNVVYAGGDGAKIEELLASRNNPVQQQNELKEQQAYIDTVLAAKTADTAGADDAAVLKELKAQYPEAEKIVVGRGLVWEKAQTAPTTQEQPESSQNKQADISNDIVVVSLEFKEPLPAKDHERLQAWLNQRYEGTAVRLLVNAKVLDK